jgi:hypothetical protein
MRTRRAVAAVLLLWLVASAGCVGFVTGTGDLTFEANDVVVSQEATSETGYEAVRDTPVNRSRTLTVAGQERTVTVVNQVAEYQRNISLGPLGEAPLARVTVFSSPEVEVAGRTLNPLADRSNPELVRSLQTSYERVEDVEAVGNRTVTVLGTETTVTRFAAEATIGGGQTIDVYVHLTKVRTGSDFVVVAAVHPQQVDAEQVGVDTMFRGVVHETDTG